MIGDDQFDPWGPGRRGMMFGGVVTAIILLLAWWMWG